MNDPIDLDAIEARAKAVPEGWDKWADWHHYQILSLVTPTQIDGWAYPEKRADAIERTEAAVEHIAGMDPATTLALVAEVRRLRACRAIEQEALANALPILADAADVANAWSVAGRAPAHHRSMQAQLRKAWPTLARAVESLASR